MADKVTEHDHASGGAQAAEEKHDAEEDSATHEETVTDQNYSVDKDQISNPADSTEQEQEQHQVQSACRRVFGIYALAENIFTKPRMSELLSGVQRTCERWNDITKSSPPIQELLFMKPVNNLRLHFEPGICSAIDRDGRTTVKKVFLHPRIMRLISLGRSDSRKFKALLSSPAMMRQEASWKVQLFPQPPMTRVEIHVRWSQWHRPCYTEAVEGLDGKVTMRQMECTFPRAGKGLWARSRNIWTAFKDADPLETLKRGENI